MPSGETRFIFITGGVVSSLGKGIAAASIGLGEAMPGLEISDLAAEDALLQNRGA